ncbi:heat shock protein [Erysiphe necator]|nr:heat shock protein [Erysiphe necator]
MLSKTLRPLPFRPLRVLKPSRTASLPLCARRKISFFPRAIVTNENPVFPPIFRLLDEFEKYSRSIDQPSRSFTKDFTPKFDVKEVSDSYELYGELPGIDQKDIDIEFTDSSTITISGHTVRSHTEGQPPRDLIENKSSSDSDSVTAQDGNTKLSENPFEKEEKTSDNQNISEDSREKFWVMERSVGEFSRSFTFPIQVDEENVTATMNNGILRVKVPKAKKQAGRKIQIQLS